MERNTRSDVYQRTIEEQNQKLEKYQAKLRGVLSIIYGFLSLSIECETTKLLGRDNTYGKAKKIIWFLFPARV